MVPPLRDVLALCTAWWAGIFLLTAAEGEDLGPNSTSSPHYNCDTEVPEGWTESKIDWCCLYEHKACRFDCDAARAGWEDGWSLLKKEWCCTNKQVGCSKLGGETTAAPTGLATLAPSTTTAPPSTSAETTPTAPVTEETTTTPAPSSTPVEPTTTAPVTEETTTTKATTVPVTLPSTTPVATTAAPATSTTTPPLTTAATSPTTALPATTPTTTSPLTTAAPAATAPPVAAATVAPGTLLPDTTSVAVPPLTTAAPVVTTAPVATVVPVTLPDISSLTVPPLITVAPVATENPPATTTPSPYLVPIALGEGGSCFEEKISWEPLDMPGTFATPAKDEAACQALCANTTGCVHFTFWWIGKNCHLQDAYAVRQSGRLGFVSGPFSCWDDVDQSEYVRKGPNNIVSKDYKCVELAVLYSPIMGLMKHFPKKSGEDAVQAVKDCRAYCASQSGCAHYTMVFPQRSCRMANAKARRLANYAGAVSGTPTCWGGVEHDHVIEQFALDDKEDEVRARFNPVPRVAGWHAGNALLLLCVVPSAVLGVLAVAKRAGIIGSHSYAGFSALE